MSKPTRSLMSASLFVYGGALLGRMLGLARETSIASSYGLSPEADILVFAIFLPDLMVLTLATASLGKVIIADLNYIEDDKRGNYYFSALFGAAVLFSCCAFALSLSSALIVETAAPHLSSDLKETMRTVIGRSVWSFPMLGMALVAVALLESSKQFQITAWRIVIYNGLVVFAILFSAGDLVSFSWLLPAAASIVFLTMFLPGLSHVTWPGISGLRIDTTLMRRYAVAVIISLLNAVPFLVPYILAGQSGTGDLTAYNLAYRLLLFPTGMCALMFDIVLYPDLAAAAARDPAELKRMARKALTRIMIATTLIAIGLYAFANPVTDLLYQYGEMTEADSKHVAGLFQIGLFSMPFYVLGTAALTISLARRDQKLAVWLSVWAAAAMLVASFALIGPFGVEGLMIAFCVMAVVRVIVGLRTL